MISILSILNTVVNYIDDTPKKKQVHFSIFSKLAYSLTLINLPVFCTVELIKMDFVLYSVTATFL